MSLVTGIRCSGYLVWLTSWFTTRIESATTPPTRDARYGRRRAARQRRRARSERDQVQQATCGQDPHAQWGQAAPCLGSGTGRGRSCRAGSGEFSWYEVAFISVGGPPPGFKYPLPVYEDLLRR